MSSDTTIMKPATMPDSSATAHDLVPAPAAPSVPRNVQVTFLHRFGEYELLNEVARGGMGVVYRARQLGLNRVVALKMILAGRLADHDDVQRFYTEAEAAGRLKHPNIVAVHEVGQVDGQHFFTMEFIEGMSLDQKLAHGPLPSKAAARYVRVLSRAVHHAHEQGIVHRDLKPSNILIDQYDEPHITDFGLAKNIRKDQGQTRTGSVLGTPSYMAPEQAQGKTNELGPLCDVYSLGAILYELLTGRPPFRAATPYDTVMQVIEHEPVPPRLLNPEIDHDVETICLKCLEKDPKLRYASADELGMDLQRYLDGESISASSFNVLDRLARMLDRSQHMADFATWSTMLFAMAALIAVEHLIVYLLIVNDQPASMILAARVIQFASLGFLFLYNRGSQLLPTTPAERNLWSIWIGYFASYFIILLATRMLIRRDILSEGNLAPDYFVELLPYPFISALSGLALFIMGASYWGRCYAFGFAFWAIAALLPLNLEFAPLAFGMLWALTLVSLGMHLRSLGVEAENQKRPPSPPTSQAPTVLFQDAKK